MIKFCDGERYISYWLLNLRKTLTTTRLRGGGRYLFVMVKLKCLGMNYVNDTNVCVCLYVREREIISRALQ